MKFIRAVTYSPRPHKRTGREIPVRFFFILRLSNSAFCGAENRNGLAISLWRWVVQGKSGPHIIMPLWSIRGIHPAMRLPGADLVGATGLPDHSLQRARGVLPLASR